MREKLTADQAIISGHNPMVLSNAISDAIFAAIQSGMEPDEAACVTISVAADYAIQAYGPDYVAMLWPVLQSRRQAALKEASSHAD